MQDIYDFLEPIHLSQINDDEGYVDGQFGKHILTSADEAFDLNTANIILVGVKETRGNGNFEKENEAANYIRKQFYNLHYWHTEIVIADVGNIKTGVTIADSYAAIKTVLEELNTFNKPIVILGGSHDVTIAQYYSYGKYNKLIEATCIDSYIDLKGDNEPAATNFLMKLFTEEPNYLKHFNHIGFQSYFIHPRMLQTIDKLHFDCYRLGRVTENIIEMEPVIRNSNMVSFDINAIKNSDAPSNKNAINGLTGVEACTLMQYAGMSTKLNSIGIYGYSPVQDEDQLTAKQISQMLWYFVDGVYRKSMEAPITENVHYNEYQIAFGELETVFLQNKRTKRWWMQMPNKEFIACSHSDYITACNNDLPERWLRIQERN
jgi:formiminoglutamase